MIQINNSMFLKIPGYDRILIIIRLCIFNKSCLNDMYIM